MYLEYIYNQPKFQTTCIYGFVFITLGNLAGNALAFGIYVIRAAGLQDNHSAHHHAVRAVAVAALTVSCLLHGSWRKGGIMVNNTLAFIKVTILLAIVGIGFASAAGASLGAGPTGKAAREQNMSVHNSFDDAHRNIGDYVGSILLAAYSFDGFQQPFNMLAEVAEPRKKFAKTTVGTMLLLTILYILVNVAFFCAIPQQVIVNDYPDLDMATIFFQELFGSKIAARVISGMIAVSILGNLVVMTLTASRVKQEIAKEGILPFSLFFANDTVTPYARLRAWLSPQKKTDELPERSPAAALSLHLALSLILVGATSSREPIVAYTILVELYEYTLVLMVGLAVAAGIVFLRWHRRQEWMESLGFHTWGGPTAAIIYATICAFLMVTLFLTPSDRSYRSSRVTKVQPYVVPTIGLCTLLMGYAYYLVFAKLIPRLKKKNLVVERDPIIVRQGGKPDGEWVVGVEVVEFWWAAKEPALAKEA
ncbi:MAG: hypothetical protein M1831_000596 [Alyxoria varia]|nr:MAG: hypothetical protein M1831_000596 [Alyxoria varia]